MADRWRGAAHARSRGYGCPSCSAARAPARSSARTSYYDVDEVNRAIAIGYTMLGRPCWRTGVNTESKLLLMQHAFETLGAVRVEWHTDMRNERSQRAIERLGAIREGVLRRHRLRPTAPGATPCSTR